MILIQIIPLNYTLTPRPLVRVQVPNHQIASNTYHQILPHERWQCGITINLWEVPICKQELAVSILTDSLLAEQQKACYLLERFVSKLNSDDTMVPTHVWSGSCVYPLSTRIPKFILSWIVEPKYTAKLNLCLSLLQY